MFSKPTRGNWTERNGFTDFAEFPCYFYFVRCEKEIGKQGGENECYLWCWLAHSSLSKFQFPPPSRFGGLIKRDASNTPRQTDRPCMCALAPLSKEVEIKQGRNERSNGRYSHFWWLWHNNEIAPIYYFCCIFIFLRSGAFHRSGTYEIWR